MMVHQSEIADTRERVAVVETKVQHLSEQVDDVQEKVNEMHALLMQARGVRWTVLVLVSLASFIAGAMASVRPFFIK